jgi:hypothetical protein
MVEPTVAGSGTLTRFLAFVVLFSACGITTLYAALNDRRGTLSIEIWRYVVVAMGTGMVYAVLGGYELLGSAVLSDAVLTGLRQVFQLFFIVLLSLSMRELYYRLPYRSAESGSTLLSHGRARLLEAAFMGIVFVEFVVVISIGLTVAVRAVQAVASVAFAAYGISFAAGTRAGAMAGGTVIDSLLVRFIAVLTCLGAAGALEGGALVGLPPTLVASAVTVFLVLSAAFLLTIALRLKANVEVETAT